MDNIAQTQQALDQMAENNKHLKSEPYTVFDSIVSCCTIEEMAEKLLILTDFSCVDCFSIDGDCNKKSCEKLRLKYVKSFLEKEILC